MGLFAATAALVLWQNSRLTVLWDLSYVLDSSWRMALGQMPYRDFPFVHAPITFLIQAAIMKLAGRVFFLHVWYAAVAGGIGTVVAWRIVLRELGERAWGAALLLAVPLVVLGVYGIFPTPYYDCDCALSVLVCIWLLQRVEQGGWWAFTAGFAAVVPLFVKQNIGLPLLMVVVAGVGLVWLLKRGQGVAGWVLCGVVVALAVAIALMHWTVGIGNYVQWTVRFPATRRIPSLAEMVGIYTDQSVLWMVPCVGLGLGLLLRTAKWARWAGFALSAVPFLWPLVMLVLTDAADDRAEALLVVWPVVLIVAATVALWELRRGISIQRLVPIFVLAAVNGCFLSKQLWGSTYAIWPLLVVLLARVIGIVGGLTHRDATTMNGARMVMGFAGVVGVSLVVGGGYYVASEERLSYAALTVGELMHSGQPELKGMTVRGKYLPNFEELLAFAERSIPRDDGLILIDGEDPFYFATGRTPQFPVLLFDPTTQPYLPAELRKLEDQRVIRWVVVKRELQILEDPTPDKQATISALTAGFEVVRVLRGYEVWRRRTGHD